MLHSADVKEPLDLLRKEISFCLGVRIRCRQFTHPYFPSTWESFVLVLVTLTFDYHDIFTSCYWMHYSDKIWVV